MPEHHMSAATKEALEKMRAYSSNPANEGITVTMSRLTEDLFTESFLGGGALINQTGDRLESEECEAWQLSGEGGAPAQFPITLSIDLSTGRVSGDWTVPGGSSQSPSFQIRYLEAGQNGQLLLFESEEPADIAVYGFTFALL